MNKNMIAGGVLVVAGILLPLDETVQYENAFKNHTPEEVACLAENAYHESRGETDRGILLVMDVVLERKYSPLFPNDICEVIYQKGQFVWYKGKRKKKPPIKEIQTLGRIGVLAIETANGDHRGIAGGALFFHGFKRKPWCNKRQEITTYEGGHVFCKLKEKVKEKLEGYVT